MKPLTEDAFRELLDERGVLRRGSLDPPDRNDAYAIFAQRSDVRLDVEHLKRQAAQFFAARLGVTVDKHYGDLSPEYDAARVVVAGSDVSGTRLVFGRVADGSDVAAAEQAERAMGTCGLALLAQRCTTIWMIVAEGTDDRAALTMAAIFASAVLGPIMSPGGGEIYGVRGARLKLEGHAPPYR